MRADSDEFGLSLPVPLLSGGVALLATVGAALVVAVTTYSILAGVVGTILVVLGLVRGSVRLLTAGAASLFVGVLVAGTLGLQPAFLLSGAFLAAMAWDAGRMALSIAEEVGRGVSTLRIEAIRLLSSTVILVAGGSLGYVVYRGVEGGSSALALVALLSGVTAILAALRAS